MGTGDDGEGQAEAPADGSRWRLSPGQPLDLGSIDTASTDGAPGGKAATNKARKRLRRTLIGLHERLWAEQGQSLLVVLQAMDGGGKDGTIKHIFRGVNPQGCEVTPFKQPTPEELAHDFLWRCHRAAPPKGKIGIFNRSHYEDVLIVRVHDLVPPEVWRSRYRRIVEFEDELRDSGTTIVKLFLHISKEEQARRLRSRLERPDKQWKFSMADLPERKRWDDYMEAFHDALVATTTEPAPWYVIPADHKWYRNWAVASILVDTLFRMDPQFPPPDPDLSSVRL